MLISRLKNSEYGFGANSHYWHGRAQSKDGPLDLVFTDNEIKKAMERAIKMPHVRSKKRFKLLWFLNKKGEV